MMWQSLIKERKSQVFISVLIVFAIIMGLGAALLFHSRSAREISRTQGEAGRAYSLAKSGLDIGQRLGAGFPKEYSIGDGTLKLTLEGTTTLVSTGTVGASTRVLKRTIGAQATTWAKAYGGSGMDLLHFVAPAGQGYILGGQEASGFGAGLDLMLIKTDSSGTKEWAYAYGGNNNESSWWHSIRKADISNDGYILAAVSTTTNNKLLIKVADDGTMTWARGLNGSGSGSLPPAVRQTSDSGYLLAVVTGADILLIKTDSGGQNPWARLYSCGVQLWAYDVLEDATNNMYIVVGYRQTSNKQWDPIIFGVRSDTGAIVFDNAFGSANTKHQFTSITLAPGGGYILGGWTDSLGPNPENFLLMKTDIAGTRIWDRVYDQATYNQEMFDVKAIANGYILGGYTVPSSYEFLVVKINLNGDLDVTTWPTGGKACGGSANEYIYSLAQTSDSGYILGGPTKSYGTGAPTENFLVAKINAEGNLSCSPNICRDAQITASAAGISTGVTFSLNVSSPAVTSVDVGPTGTNLIRRYSADSVITTNVCQ